MSSEDSLVSDLSQDEWKYIDSNELPGEVDGIMADTTWRNIFQEFAKLEYSAEAIDTYVTIEEYEANPSRERGTMMYKSFIADGSPSQANLSGSTVNGLKEWFGFDMDEWTKSGDQDMAELEKGTVTEPPADVFAAAKRELVTNMSDTLSRFKPVIRKLQNRPGRDF